MIGGRGETHHVRWRFADAEAVAVSVELHQHDEIFVVDVSSKGDAARCIVEGALCNRSWRQNLFEQFMKKANAYFLVIAILSSMPFSPKNPWVSILPLIFVLTVSAVKEAIEDYAR